MDSAGGSNEYHGTARTIIIAFVRKPFGHEYRRKVVHIKNTVYRFQLHRPQGLNSAQPRALGQSLKFAVMVFQFPDIRWQTGNILRQIPVLQKNPVRVNSPGLHSLQSFLITPDSDNRRPQFVQ